MRNNYKESYKSLIINACNNENNKVREMACSICDELSLQWFPDKRMNIIKVIYFKKINGYESEIDELNLLSKANESIRILIINSI